MPRITFPPAKPAVPTPAYWNQLLGSLDNEQYVPFKDVAGVIKEILKVTSGNETQLKSAGEDVVIETPEDGKSLRVIRRYF